MKIVSIEDFHADGGWRTLSFLKISTDEGLVGWSEFHEGAATPGLAQAIRSRGAELIGVDPCNVSALAARLYAMSRNATGGLMAQAHAAIENACLDIKAKSLGVPVYELFGGALRQRLPLYWSQCGTLRARYPALFGAEPLRSLDDVVRLGAEVKASGYTALKTNVLLFAEGSTANHRPGFGSGKATPDLNLEPSVLRATVDLLHALRQGAGDGVGLMLDLNFNFRPEGVRRLVRALEPLGLDWLELDLYEPGALAAIRERSTMPIASLESIYGRRALLPFLDAQAVDVAIIDPQWNGFVESVKMASLADTFEVNIAPHNYHGHLSTLMGAHLAAAVPNLRTVEFVVDEAPWTPEFLCHPLEIERGELTVPTRPGWGSDIDEDALRRHPPRTPRA